MKIGTFRLFVLLTLIMGVRTTHSTTIVPLSLEKITKQSELIFQGKVIKSKSSRDPRTKLIHTEITFKNLDTLKGKTTNDLITLNFLGGQVGDEVLEVKEMILPHTEETGIYFVETINKKLINPLTGWSQGHYIIQQDEHGTSRILTNQNLPVTNLLPENTYGSLIQGRFAINLQVGKRHNTSTALNIDQFKDIIKSLNE